MLASILIIVFSLVLFVYWFRYSCILLISSRGEQQAGSSEGFNYATVQEQLKAGLELDPLHRSLQRDYRLLTYLLEHAASLELERMEYRLLVMDYRLMQGWYRVTKSFAPSQARRALNEMADVLGVMGSRIGQQAGVHTEV